MYSIGNRIEWLQGPGANCAKTGPVAPRPWHLVLLGPPGVGKGTQAEKIIGEFGACHLSTGDVFRYAARDTSGLAPSPAMATALAAMKRGELVSDTTVVELVRERAGCLRGAGRSGRVRSLGLRLQRGDGKSFARGIRA